jgi:hypothetical protein
MVRAMTTMAPVIDGDGHVTEPADLGVERMDDDKWRDCILGRNAIDAYRLVI